MAEKIIMPKQGLHMTEGFITAWLAREGDIIVAGEPLFEMETDKLAITIDSPVSGVLLKILTQEGESAPITETIAIAGAQGEDISGLMRETGVQGEGSAGAWGGDGAWGGEVQGSGAVAWGDGNVQGGDRAWGGSENGSGLNEGDGYGRLNESAAGERDGDRSQDKNAAGERDSGQGGCRRILISPRAKRIAIESGVDWQKLSGSAPGGMIVERDVLTALLASKKNVPVKNTAAINATATNGAATYDATISAASIASAQKTIQPTTPVQAVHVISVYMDETTRICESLNKSIKYHDFIIFATVRALRDYPSMNVEWTDEGISHKNHINLGFTAVLDDGLITPVIKDAHLLTLSGISGAIRTLTEKAGKHSLAPDDCAGGSFTVTNPGIYGLDESIAVINQTESGILAAGRICDTPVAIGGNVEIRKVMKLTLTYDYRAINGATAALFLSRVKSYLENPLLMI